MFAAYSWSFECFKSPDSDDPRQTLRGLAPSSLSFDSARRRALERRATGGSGFCFSTAGPLVGSVIPGCSLCEATSTMLWEEERADSTLRVVDTVDR